MTLANCSKAVCKPCPNGCGDLVCDTKTGDCVCDPAVTCHGNGSCAPPGVGYLCSCSNHWDVKTNCETCPAGWGGTDCNQSTAPPVLPSHFPYKNYNVGGTNIQLPFLMGGWIPIVLEGSPPEPPLNNPPITQEMLDFLLNSNFNYLTYEYYNGANYPTTPANWPDFYMKWRAKGKIALMNLSPGPYGRGQGCKNSWNFDTNLFTRCVNWRKKGDNCEWGNQGAAPYDINKNGSGGWTCTSGGCPAISGYNQFDAMDELKATIEQRKAQVGDFDGFMLDYEYTAPHGWEKDDPDLLIPRMKCFLNNLITAGVYVGHKKLIVFDFNRWGCWKNWSKGIADLLNRLTKEISTDPTIAANFIVLFEVETYLYTGDDYKTCVEEGDKKQKKLSRVVDDVVNGDIMNQTARQFSYFLFSAFGSGSNGAVPYAGRNNKSKINPMSEVIDNFAELYNSGLISLSFYYLDYYTMADLKLLSDYVQQNGYIIKG